MPVEDEVNYTQAFYAAMTHHRLSRVDMVGGLVWGKLRSIVGRLVGVMVGPPLMRGPPLACWLARGAI